jgi:hypothetical protein
VQSRPSRQLWIAALAVSLICVAGLAYALVTDWNTPPIARAPVEPREGGAGAPGAPPVPSGRGFGSGVLLGLGAGIVLGSLLGLRAGRRSG